MDLNQELYVMQADFPASSEHLFTDIYFYKFFRFEHHLRQFLTTFHIHAVSTNQPRDKLELCGKS